MAAQNVRKQKGSIIMSLLEQRAMRFSSKRYGNMVQLKAIPGHFATNHSHVNYFIDLTTIKRNHAEALACARALARYFATTMKPVETIVCLDGTDVIGAFLAKEICDSMHISHQFKYTIDVVHPECNSNCQFFFRENVEPMIRGKHVILLMASVTTGITIRHGMECMEYYGGKLEGVSTIFSAVKEMDGMPINTIFTPDDIPGYASYDRRTCPYCQKNQRVQALINSFGYSQI